MLALQPYRQPRRRSLLATQRSQPARTPDRRRKRTALRLQLTQIADNHNSTSKPWLRRLRERCALRGADLSRYTPAYRDVRYPLGINLPAGQRPTDLV